MKKVILNAAAILIIGVMASCNQAPTGPIGAELDKQIDSIKQSKLEQLTTDMQKICDEKMSKEVIMRADSIVKAMKESKNS